MLMSSVTSLSKQSVDRAGESPFNVRVQASESWDCQCLFHVWRTLVPSCPQMPFAGISLLGTCAVSSPTSVLLFCGTMQGLGEGAV